MAGKGFDGLALKLGLGFRTILDMALYPFGLHRLTHFNKSYTGNPNDDLALQQRLINKIKGDAFDIPYPIN